MKNYSKLLENADSVNEIIKVDIATLVYFLIPLWEMILPRGMQNAIDPIKKNQINPI